MSISVLVHGKRVATEVVKENAKTLWVRLNDGNVIKRHKAKHEVAA